MYDDPPPSCNWQIAYKNLGCYRQLPTHTHTHTHVSMPKALECINKNHIIYQFINMPVLTNSHKFIAHEMSLYGICLLMTQFIIRLLISQLPGNWSIKTFGCQAMTRSHTADNFPIINNLGFTNKHICAHITMIE